MSRYTYVTKIKVAGLFFLALAACSNNNSGTGGGRDSYTIQVNAFGANLGLGTAALTVTETNSGQSLTFSGTSASQTLNHQFASGDAYNFSIANPTAPAQTCALSASSPPPSGTVASNLTFDITCTIVTVNVTGSISGLTGSGLVLQISNGTPATEAITSASNGSFSFKVPSGSTWAISAAAQPTGPSETCSGPSSTAPVGSTDITGLVVTCTPVPYSVTAIVSGLQGTGLTLTDGVSGTVPVAVNKNGPFTVTFPNVPAGSAYAVAQAGQVTGPSQTCAVDPSGPPQSGTIAGNLTFNITCTTTAFNVSGSISGLKGSGLVLQISNGSPATEAITATSGGVFSFKVPSGSSWAISAAAQPTGPAETCSGPSSTAPVGSADITGLVVTCTPVPYTVTAIVAGLQGTGLTLTDGVAGTAPIAVNKNGPFTVTFANVPAGSTYALAPVTQVTAPSQTCAVDSSGPPSSGTISGNLTFNITCTTTAFNVSGSVAGLTGSGLVLQITNGTPSTEQITTGPNGAFSFKVLSGSSWAITAAAEPTGPAETCTGPSSTAPVGAADVTGLVVTCTPVPYTVTTTVVNLLGTGLTLTDGVSGTAPILVPVNKTGTTTITFPNIPAGTSYSVAQVGQVTNPSQTCGPTPGTSASAPSINSDVQVSITCTTSSYPLGFTLSGSSGLGMQATLLVDGSAFSTLLVTDNTCVPTASNSATCNATSSPPSLYTFPTNAPSGATYQIEVSAQNDSGQNCLVWNVGGSGSLGSASPPNATIACKTVPSYALNTGQDSTGQGLVALFTLTDPNAGLGFLTDFINDPYPFPATVSTVAPSVAVSAGFGTLSDYIAQVDYSASPTTSYITDYSFEQPPSTPVVNAGATTNFPGSVLAMLYDQNNATLLVCYSDQSGDLFFQAFTYDLQAIGSPTPLTTNGFDCSLYMATNSTASSTNTFVYAYYVDSTGATQSYYLHGFNLGPANVTLTPTAVISDSGTQFVSPFREGEGGGTNSFTNTPSIDPQGRFIYIASNTANCGPNGCQYQLLLNGYSISPNSGQLTPIASNPLWTSTSGTTYSPLLFEPSGTFVYVPSGTTIVPFSIDGTKGVLNSTLNGISLLPSSIGDQIAAASIDPSGTFLIVNGYSSNESSFKLLSYSINPTNGSLTELTPISLASSSSYSPPIIDPSGQYVYVESYINSMSSSYVGTFNPYSLNALTGILQSITGPTPAQPPLTGFEADTNALIFQ